MNKVLFSDGCIYDNKLYFVDDLKGLPQYMELSTGQIKIIDNLKGYEYCGRDSIDMMLCHNEKIYALLSKGDKLMVWDIKYNSCIYVDIECKNKDWGNFAYFSVYEDDVYIFPKYVKEVVIVSQIDYSVRRRMYSTDIEVVCGQIMNRNVWLFPKNGRKILCFDLQTEIFKEYDVLMLLTDCLSCTISEENIYILNERGIIYKWNIERQFMSCIKEMEFENSDKIQMYPIVYAGNKLFMFPAYENQIKAINLKNEVIETVEGYPSDFQYYNLNKWHYYRYCKDKNNIYMACRESNYVLLIEMQTGDVSWIKPWSKDCCITENNIIMKYANNVVEENVLGLKFYVENIYTLNKEKYVSKVRKADLIWNQVRKE